MSLIGGHHETCAVFKMEPDGGPSLSPCDCRLTLGPVECTGVSAQWCPIHGDCKCDREDCDLDSPDCPLHNRQSTHAELLP